MAIDDAGAGHASMRHVTQLSPDYIKIDRSLIHDIHVDHAKRALVRSMVSLEEDLGAKVVAEGIERTEELRTLRELGVPLGQGFLLARPHRDADARPRGAPRCSSSPSRPAASRADPPASRVRPQRKSGKPMPMRGVPAPPSRHRASGPT